MDGNITDSDGRHTPSAVAPGCLYLGAPPSIGEVVPAGQHCGRIGPGPAPQRQSEAHRGCHDAGLPRPAPVCDIDAVKIAVLLSGGVDSSVALNLLRRQGGAELSAYYLKIWLEDELSSLGECPWEEDLGFARAVCERAGVPLTVLSMQREYYDRVVAYALEELRAGRTPSPDILCNTRIKFGAFLDALGDGADRLATGHYARIRADGDRFLLERAPDPVKDQTYFLSHLRQEQLARAMFPVGHLRKSQVRRLAEEMDLPNRDRADSQGICFLGRIRYPDFVRHYLGERDGELVERETGRLLGRHRGYWFYTIGQRSGLGLSGGPWYVAAKDTAENVIYLSHKEHVAGRSAFTVSRISWIAGPPRTDRLGLKIRHGPSIATCTVEPRGTDLRVTMEPPDPGIAPGQFAVFYDGPVCLGGGVIAD